MGSTASNWTNVTTLSEGKSSPLPQPSQLCSYKKHETQPLLSVSIPPSLPPAPQYVSPFSVDSNLTVIWLDWAGSFALNGYLKEFSVTESQLRVYTGFYSYLYVPRTSQKSESTHTHKTHTYTHTYTFVQGGNFLRGMSTSKK